MIDTRNLVAGAIGGLAGGLMMTAAMTAGKQAGMVKEPLPLKVEHWGEQHAGTELPLSPNQEMVASQGGHLVYSAILGAGYGALKATLNAPAIPTGPLFGAALYALNLGAIGPGLGITSEPWNQEPMTTGRQLMMHIAYGTVTALVTDQLIEQRDGHQSSDRWHTPMYGH